MAKVILLSQSPLPFSRIGSWTTMYRNYLSAPNQIDVIVCEKPAYFFNDIQYELVAAPHRWDKISEKISKKKFVRFTQALGRLIKADEKYVIQIIDNLGMAKAVQQYLDENGLRNRCYLQYFYHGFPPLANNASNINFYEKTDEIIVLTHSTYAEFKRQAHILPCRFSVLHNGIDNKRFFPLTDEVKTALRDELGFQTKTLFLWCSHDRPKKGLSLILDVWQRVYEKNTGIELLVIGAKDRHPQPGVTFMSSIPNDELPKYYQIADVYLFSTLCLEGFGMSLTEALHCGCHCMASALGGVPEVLQNGRLGKLIENPHFISEWEAAINEYLKGEGQQYPPLGDLYTAEQWQQGMEAITGQGKRSLEK